MIHLRYDWRRPLLWVTICLTFFLSSQTSVGKKTGDQEAGMINLVQRATHIQDNTINEILNEDKFELYLFIVKK